MAAAGVAAAAAERDARNNGVPRALIENVIYRIKLENLTLRNLGYISCLIYGPLVNLKANM